MNLTISKETNSQLNQNPLDRETKVSHALLAFKWDSIRFSENPNKKMVCQELYLVRFEIYSSTTPLGPINCEI